jgi:hypothetical protein
MGTTYTLVDVPDGADADTICEAIRAGRVELRANALSIFRAASILCRMLVAGWIGRIRPPSP